MPNKIPRACAVTIWTWTDEESEFYENEISFVNKDAVKAKCLTTHTQCSDSDFDGEALEHIASCDASTIVKGDGHSMDNRLLYDIFPPRAFPNHWSNQPFYVRYAEVLAVSTLLMMVVVVYKVMTRKKAKNMDYAPISEYEPLT